MKFQLILPFVALAAARPRPYTPSAKAIYFLDSDPSGASVVSLKVGRSGKIASPVRTSTGGKGLIGVNATGAPVGADPVFSQGAVEVFSDKLFAVSPGSNTLSMFHIPSSDPTHPYLLGKPVSTVGNVPNSVAYSPEHELACVTNTGTTPGVQCFSSRHGYLEPYGKLFPLPIKQTSLPPAGPTNTASDIGFSPDGKYLMATVKGDGTNPGYVFVWAMEHGKMSSTPVISRPAGLLVDFGFDFLSGNRAVITDPAYGASYVTIHSNLTVTVDKKITISGEKAICWSAATSDSVFLLDAGRPDIQVLDAYSGAIKASSAGNVAGKGNFDGAPSGDKLYVLQSAPGVAVYDIKNGQVQVAQFLDLTSLGSRASWTGMAVYESYGY